MTTKNIKTILFAGLIAAMILPFSMMDVAEAEKEAKKKKIDVEKTLAKAAPFTSVDENKMVIVDYDTASEVLKKKELKFIKKITDEQNRFINSLKPTIAAASKATASEQNTEELNSKETKQLQDYFATLENSSSNNNTEAVAAQLSFCAWWAQGAPSQNNPPTYATTLAGAQDYLEGLGYHQTPAYATYGYPNPPSVPYERQFNDFISAHGCWDGVFRSEGVIHADFENYFKSSPEPNPELLGYIWPHTYWPVYVAGWHNNY